MSSIINKFGKLIGLTMGLFILGISSSSVSNASDIAVIGWGSLPLGSSGTSCGRTARP